MVSATMAAQRTDVSWGDHPGSVRRWIVSVGQKVSQGDELALLSVPSTSGPGVARLTSPATGRIEKLLVQMNAPCKPGFLFTSNAHLILSRQVVALVNTCDHHVHFCGLCTLCQMDVSTFQHEISSERIIASNPGLKISHEKAKKEHNDLVDTLMREKKLYMVLDLDLTVIQAALADDTTTPFVQALRESGVQVEEFLLTRPDLPPGQRYPPGHQRQKYYIKFRPGLREFLQEAAQLFDIHVYTMGSRDYAIEVVKLMDQLVADPTRALLKDGFSRIMTRNESTNLESKNLRSVLPHGDEIAIILDDREDVWRQSVANLLQVNPYNFFPSVGDLNDPSKLRALAAGLPIPVSVLSEQGLKRTRVEAESSELPPAKMPRVEEPLSSPPPPSPPSTPISPLSPPLSPPEAPSLLPLVSLPTGAAKPIFSLKGAPSMRKKKVDSTDPLSPPTAPLLTSPPIFQAQFKSTYEALPERTSETPEFLEQTQRLYDLAVKRVTDMPPERDTILPSVLAILREVHRRFFTDYETNGQISDVKRHLRELREGVLSGCRIFFTHVFPLGLDSLQQLVVQRLQRHGGFCCTTWSDRATHLICGRPGTDKHHEAVKRQEPLYLVAPAWMDESMWHWRRLPEQDFPVWDMATTPPIRLPTFLGPQPPDILPSIESSLGSEVEDELPTEPRPSATPRSDAELMPPPPSPSRGPFAQPHPLGMSQSSMSDESDLLADLDELSGLT